MNGEHWTKEQLIPVRSESELKAGMTVVVKDCLTCQRAHWRILVSVAPQVSCKWAEGHKSGWNTVANCRLTRTCFCDSVVTGRLFRLDTGIDEAADQRQAELDHIRSTLRAGGVITVQVRP